MAEEMQWTPVPDHQRMIEPHRIPFDSNQHAMNCSLIRKNKDLEDKLAVVGTKATVAFVLAVTSNLILLLHIAMSTGKYQ